VRGYVGVPGEVVYTLTIVITTIIIIVVVVVVIVTVRTGPTTTKDQAFKDKYKDKN